MNHAEVLLGNIYKLYFFLVELYHIKLLYYKFSDLRSKHSLSNGIRGAATAHGGVVRPLGPGLHDGGFEVLPIALRGQAYLGLSFAVVAVIKVVDIGQNLQKCGIFFQKQTFFMTAFCPGTESCFV